MLCSSYTVDASGQRQDVQDVAWRQARVSSAVRSLACLQTDLDRPEANFRGASVVSPLMDRSSAAVLVKDFAAVRHCLHATRLACMQFETVAHGWEQLAFSCGELQYRQHMLWPSSPGLRNSIFQLLYQGLLQQQLTTEVCRVQSPVLYAQSPVSSANVLQVST